MPEFLWRAAHADGQAAEGRTEAAAEADVLRQLRERGLTPIRVQPAGQAEGAALAGPRPRAAPSSPPTCSRSPASWPSCCAPGWRSMPRCACSST